MATKTVSGKVTKPDGSAAANAGIRATLSQPCVIAGTQEVVASVVAATSAADGTYSLTLQANNDLSPTGTYYTVTSSTLDGGYYQRTIVVPQTAGPFVITSIETAPPTLGASPSHVSTLTVDGAATFTGAITAAALNGTLFVPLSGDTTGATDQAAIQANMTTAGATGAPVQLLAGDYFINNPLLWDKRSAVVQVHAPTLLGAGNGGDPALVTQQGGVTRIVAAPTFPAQQYMIDYLGPTAPNIAMSGFEVGKFLLECIGVSGTVQATGMRFFNQWAASIHDITVWTPASPNPTVKPNAIAPDGAVALYAWASSQAYNNTLDHVHVQRSGYSGFFIQEGPGSRVTATKCTDFQSAAYGFHVGACTELIGCETSAESNVCWYIHDATGAGGSWVVMSGCTSAGSNYGQQQNQQTLWMVGETYMTLAASGCVFYGGGTGNYGELNSSVFYFTGTPVATFTGCNIAASTHTTDYVYLGTGLGAGSSILFEGSQFLGGNGFPNPLTQNFNLNGNSGTMLTFQNCLGINPVGLVTVAVPATGVAVAAQPYDRTFYVTTAALGCTMTIQNGPAVVVPASSFGTVRVPAGKTVTPTFTNAPTWVVEGE